MKLVVAIVHDEDLHDLMHKFNDEEIGFTKISSTGGFLKSGNSTLMIGVEEDRIEQVLSIIRENCKTRKEVVPTGSMMTDANSYVSFPIEVSTGGATIFVLNVENTYKL